MENSHIGFRRRLSFVASREALARCDALKDKGNPFQSRVADTLTDILRAGGKLAGAKALAHERMANTLTIVKIVLRIAPSFLLRAVNDIRIVLISVRTRAF